nr:MAG TPA: hypothetical protein [Caudoviricetes sp.]
MERTIIYRTQRTVTYVPRKGGGRMLQCMAR